ncbi:MULTISPECIES: DUF5819 family protein [Streptomycetaceae]|uniref:Uncharacterized protein n=1 Tax=Streptantibioticus cattleyicolor (strain ATCC 35852 / DSM 46488 / JCM 4925 / NBRC 14057 / NRRL 8057) TaxID=1003195 RepID=F8JSB5_STREN|nr:MULTISPECIES: DUF5819 family protein [Streptomycetaceae]AEW95429.1 hypothetical protein SCATT_30580 [Streptantibioticus cattleyicolor NRRL 8057 = DSM 46488]MYS59998.1 hypothetical protein [Streptomyces sp. SID5468]CCB75772.1 putative membrane protein [Streptantibioticus cattleyicolor NRRL 8057 = DSM 46488]
MEPPEDRAAEDSAAKAGPGGGTGNPPAGPVPQDAPGRAGAVGEPAPHASDDGRPADGSGQDDPAGDASPDDGTAPDQAPSGEAAPDDGAGAIAGLSIGSRIVLALAVAAVVVGAAVHCAMVFLHIAPANTVSQTHAAQVNGYIYPEFEQNWKLFAPNPVQQNTDIQARAEVWLPDGTVRTTGWVDLTAMDLARIRHDPLPSHTAQNELRRAWMFFTDSHDNQGRPVGVRGDLSTAYVRRIVAHRFGPRLNGGAVHRVQVRSAVSNVPAPPWSTERVDTSTTYHVAPWWAVTDEDFK